MVFDDLLIAFNILYFQENIYIVFVNAILYILTWVFAVFTSFWPAGISSMWRFKCFKNSESFCEATGFKKVRFSHHYFTAA